MTLALRRAITRFSSGSAVTPRAAGLRGVVLRVPHMTGGIVLDGDTDDPGWTSQAGPARTGPFLTDKGTPARPYSETRLVWGDGHLYLALYAADEDIRSRAAEADGPLWLDDSFRLVFTRGDVEYAIEVSPTGTLTDAIRSRGEAFNYSWNSGAHVSHEQDGTLNDSTDFDEEWAIEMAIPFDVLGMRGERGERIGFKARRCDTPRNEARVCGSWGEGGSGAELVLF
ncbi:MAG: carbohydrate-binding family 9-like protein [Myxococcota bacterium]|nr:carbohydrate-binding family 9-like protein [Myxococcota bacterium]